MSRNQLLIQTNDSNPISPFETIFIEKIIARLKSSVQFHEELQLNGTTGATKPD